MKRFKAGIRFWWPAFVIIFLLFLGLTMRLPTIGDMAEVALVAVTLMYVMSSYNQAQAITRMAEEMRKQRLGVEQIEKMTTSIAELFKIKEETKGEVTTLDTVDITTMDSLIMAWLALEWAFIGVAVNDPKHATEYKDQILGALRDVGGLNKLMLDIVEKDLIRLTEKLEKMK